MFALSRRLWAGSDRRFECALVNGRETLIMIDGGRKRGRTTLASVRELAKMEGFCGLTAFVVRRFEGVELVGGIIESIDMDSSNQDSDNSTINTKTTRDIYKSRRNRTART